MAPAALSVALGLSLPVLAAAQAHRGVLYIQRQPECADDVPTTSRPQTLHQIAWRGESSLPAHLTKLSSSWLKHNPQWSRRVWDEQSINQLLEQSYPWLADTFKALPTNLQREEVAVYLVLHAHGGVFADVDMESFQEFATLPEGAVLQLFEEPVEKWEVTDARGNSLSHHVISTSLMSVAEPGHPLLRRILEAVRPDGEAYAPTNGQLIQKELRRCQSRNNEDCGCYRTLTSPDFFPAHSALRPIVNFTSSLEYIDELRQLVSDIKSRKWPAASAFTVRWGLSRIDTGLDRLLVDGLDASLRDDEGGDTMLRALVSEEWGKKEKYMTDAEARDISKARKSYEKAARLAPTYAWPHYELGNIELESKRYDEAREHFKKAVALEPTAILFHNNLGVTELNLGKHKEAAASFRRVLELHPQTDDRIRRMAPEAGAHYNLGIALNASHQAEEALTEIRTALHSGSSHFARIAARRLSMAGALEVPDAEVGYIIGDALFSEGRTREASVTLARAYELASALPELRERISQMMRKLADVWSVGSVPNEIRLPGAIPAKGSVESSKGMQNLQYVRANADGSTSVEDMGEVTPELLQQIQEGKVQLPA
eukprot:scaffold183549_cov33-Tisochrysis_lutea.AAC.1